ncbi:MFS transporter [candidate division WWE3 bacterium]|nr:MFS transporter [candidate division WWE3 bacterium]
MPFLKNSARSKVNTVFGFFAVFTFFVYLGDAVMSYVTPVFLDNKVSDPFWTGVIFATSSAIGLIFNFLAGEVFGSKSTNFFVRATIFAALAFPLAFLLAPNYIPMYLLGMAAWGIYYETQAFASFKFIELTRRKDEYSEAWGTIATVTSVAYFVGPIIATYLIDHFLELNFYVAIGCYITAYLIYQLMKAKSQLKEKAEKIATPVTPKIELKRWVIYMKRLWPLWSFGWMMYLIEAFFWTIGIVYAESLKGESELAGFIISVHVLPTILIGLIMSKLKIKTGKKKWALLSGLVAGVILFGFGWARNINEILMIVAGYSVFSAISFNLLWATYEDYVSREDKYENDLIGLEQSASSLAWVIGPIIAGSVTEFVGAKMTMSYAGLALFIGTIFIFFVIPKKIYMPHKPFSRI